MDDTGAIETMTRKIYPKESGFSGEGIVVQSIQKDGDSLRVEMSGAGGTREFAIESEPGLLPFIDMVHWPYELALNQAAVSGKDTVNQRMLTGSSVSDFIDRKSTRLNSSHVATSYAVFCLKKKI